MYYLIKSTLEECDGKEVHNGEYQYVVVLSPEEWKKEQASFDIGIEMDINTDEIHNTKAEVNFDSLTGTFCIPSRRNIIENEYKYAFAIDEKGIVFIDPTGVVERMVKRIKGRKRWKVPCLERFIYDFLELIIARDLSILEKYEKELDEIYCKLRNNLLKKYTNKKIPSSNAVIPDNLYIKDKNTSVEIKRFYKNGRFYVKLIYTDILLSNKARKKDYNEL